MDKIIVIGGRGAAVNIAEHILDAIDNHGMKAELLGFAIDDPTLGNQIVGIPIVCKIREIKTKYPHSEVKLIFALYKPTVMHERVQLFRSLELPRERMFGFIHPSAYVSRSARFGIGNVISAGVAVQSNACLGDFNIIHSNVLIGHDTSLGNHNIVAGGACVSSEVGIGDGNFIGLNSTVRDRARIGDYNILGMGSNLLENIESFKIAVGNPGRVVSDNPR